VSEHRDVVEGMKAMRASLDGRVPEPLAAAQFARPEGAWERRGGLRRTFRRLTGGGGLGDRVGLFAVVAVAGDPATVHLFKAGMGNPMRVGDELGTWPRAELQVASKRMKVTSPDSLSGDTVRSGSTSKIARVTLTGGSLEEPLTLDFPDARMTGRLLKALRGESLENQA
jgi:hypothetical protein